MVETNWPQLPGEGPGPGGGVDNGAAGHGDSVRGGAQQAPKSYSGIASINKSVRDNKNVLEDRLEKDASAKFNLSTTETEGLLTKIGIDSFHILGVSSCPEGKGVVYIRLHPSGLSIGMKLMS